MGEEWSRNEREKINSPPYNKRRSLAEGGDILPVQYTAMNIANFFIQLVQSISDDTIDNLKLNKILYYTQGWSLVRLGRPLFTDEIHAWEYGPVVPAVYHQFKVCKNQPIGEVEDTFDESILSSKELDLLIDVYRKYGKYTGVALKNMTHMPGTPWEVIYERGKNNVITLESMDRYFRKEALSAFEIDSLGIPVITAVPPAWDSNEDAIYD